MRRMLIKIILTNTDIVVSVPNDWILSAPFNSTHNFHTTTKYFDFTYCWCPENPHSFCRNACTIVHPKPSSTQFTLNTVAVNRIYQYDTNHNDQWDATIHCSGHLHIYAAKVTRIFNHVIFCNLIWILLSGRSYWLNIPRQQYSSFREMYHILYMEWQKCYSDTA